MIYFLKHNEIDRKKWDLCIDNSVNSLTYAYSWYLDIVCPGWNALIENNYLSVMPLTAKRKFGINYLYPPYFAQQLGIFSQNEISFEKAQSFLNQIPDIYRFIEIHLNTHNTFEYPGFHIKKNVNLLLKLNASYESLRQSFSDDAKRNIAKSVRHRLRLQKNIRPEEIISLFRKNTGKKISNLKEENYRTLLNLIHACSQRGLIETWGAFSENNHLCSGAVWLIQKNRAIFLFSGNTINGKKAGGMYFLIDQFIRENAGKEMILDFEGSNIPGLARFYKGFGSTETIYLQVRKNKLPKLVRWLKE